MIEQRQTAESLEQQRRSFPALGNKSYMNFGAQGVLPHQALAAIVEAFEFIQSNGPLSMSMFGWLTEQCHLTRRALSEELGGRPEEFALTQNVTEGCNIAMWGINWNPGDQLLISDCEHPGVVAAAHQISSRLKLDLRICQIMRETTANGIIAALERACTNRTKLVVLSHVLWNTGELLPVDEIVRLCHTHGALVLLDGAQSAGAVPLNLDQLKADFYAITGHKWLCGPEGLGALYVNSAALKQLEPTFVGWRGSRFNRSGTPIAWEDGAVRFEVATAPFPLLSGLRAAIAVHHLFGDVRRRYDQIVKNAQRLKDGLSQIPGVHWLSNSLTNTGLVTFMVEGCSHHDLCESLEQKRIFIRTLPSPDALRASVHYLNTSEEIDGFIACLSDLVWRGQNSTV